MTGLESTADLASRHPSLTGALQALERASRSRGGVADAIDALFSQAIAAGVSLEFDALLQRLPAILADREAMDALVSGVLDSREAQGHAPADTLERLCQARPDLESQIRVTGMLRSLVRGGMGGGVSGSPTATSRPRDLPSGFGPPIAGGPQRYELVERVGRGSQGQVYRAIDRVMSSPDRTAWVAIKILPELDPTASHFSTLEASLAHRVRHGGVVSVLDRGSHKGEEYIAYEFVDGTTLEQWRQSRGASVRARDAARLLVEIADAIQAAHAAGVIHRDLQPRNVIIDSGGRARVTDFGLGMWSGDRRSPVAGATPAFAAPEQMTDRWVLQDGRADVYALGGILLWLITGQAPGLVLGRSDSREERSRSLAKVWDTVVPQVDRTLRAIVARALEFQPADRFDSPAELREALRRWLDRIPVPGIDDAPARRLSLAVRRAPAFTGALVGLVALLAVAAAIWHRMEADRQRLLISMQLDAGRHQLLEDRMAMVRDTVERYSVIFAPGELHPVNLELLPLLGPLEHMASVSGMSLGTFDDLYGNRAITVRSMLDGTEQMPPLRGATRVIWAEALALWQMRAMEHQQALATIDEASSDAARVLRPDDPIHDELRALRALAVARAKESRTADDAASLQGLDNPALPRTIRRLIAKEVEAILADAGPPDVTWFVPDVDPVDPDAPAN